ncbi:MAG TPA: DUF433 domain-containing protein [Anaerolineae bacterium]|jgi:uncharacterized protein (DUF433 family)
MTVTTRYEHIVVDENQVALIDGTTMKVTELVLVKQSYGWSPEELHFQFPYLTIGQIYSALAYYYDHQEQLDQDIARRARIVQDIKQLSPTPSLVSQLKAQGLV